MNARQRLVETIHPGWPPAISLIYTLRQTYRLLDWVALSPINGVHVWCLDLQTHSHQRS